MFFLSKFFLDKSIEKSELSDIGLVGTSRAENLNLTYFLDTKYDCSNLKAWNGLFGDLYKIGQSRYLPGKKGGDKFL